MHGYETISEHLKVLHDVNAPAHGVDIQHISSGGNILESLVSTNAKWHKAWYDLCSIICLVS